MNTYKLAEVQLHIVWQRHEKQLRARCWFISISHWIGQLLDSRNRLDVIANTNSNSFRNRTANLWFEDSHIIGLTLMTKNLYTFQSHITSYLTTNASQDAFRSNFGIVIHYRSEFKKEWIFIARRKEEAIEVTDLLIAQTSPNETNPNWRVWCKMVLSHISFKSYPLPIMWKVTASGLWYQQILDMWCAQLSSMWRQKTAEFLSISF